LTQQHPKAEHRAGKTGMELFNVMTRLAFGATLIFAAILVLCEQLISYFS
jgi:hypothetical protein